MFSHLRSPVNPWGRVPLLVLAAGLFPILVGCGTGSGVSLTGGTETDQAAILEALEANAFFVDSVTETNEDEEAAAAAQAQLYDGQVSPESLSDEPGSAQLPRFWWRGDLERLGRSVDIHIENGIADVKGVHHPRISIDQIFWIPGIKKTLLTALCRCRAAAPVTVLLSS